MIDKFICFSIFLFLWSIQLFAMQATPTFYRSEEHNGTYFCMPANANAYLMLVDQRWAPVSLEVVFNEIKQQNMYQGHDEQWYFLNKIYKDPSIVVSFNPHIKKTVVPSLAMLSEGKSAVKQDGGSQGFIALINKAIVSHSQEFSFEPSIDASLLESTIDAMRAGNFASFALSLRGPKVLGIFAKYIKNYPVRNIFLNLFDVDDNDIEEFKKTISTQESLRNLHVSFNKDSKDVAQFIDETLKNKFLIKFSIKTPNLINNLDMMFFLLMDNGNLQIFEIKNYKITAKEFRQLKERWKPTKADKQKKVLGINIDEQNNIIISIKK